MQYSLGIVIPVYNSASSVELLVRRIGQCFDPDFSCRIILVDDGSKDGSPSVIRDLAQTSSRVTAICLDGNYGQQNAVLCGLRHARNCRYVATMDDDLQHPPEVLKILYEKISSEQLDVVYAVPKEKHLKALRRAGSALRDGLFRLFANKPKHLTVSSFRIFNAPTAAVLRSETQAFVYLSASAFRRPIKAAMVEYDHPDRAYGKSGYTFGKLMRLGFNLFVYYTKAGSLLKPKKGNPQYVVESVTLPGVKNKRLMILGGSLCQLNAFKKAEALGFQTILADYLCDPPAADIADLHLRISTFDRQACEHAAKEHRVDGIITLGTDQPVYTMAAACERLNLPCPVSTETAYLATNKKAMKERLRRFAIPTAAYRLIGKASTSQALDGLNAPYVIKPLDSQGQRGIFKLDTAQEVLAHLDETLSFSAEKEALVEEYYPSDEITVSGWVTQGALTVLTVTDRKHYADTKHIGICNEHRFPSKHQRHLPEIEAIAKEVTAAFGIGEGPLYIQMFIGTDGIKVNELACRIGGAFEDVFIPYLTGFDILDAVIKTSLGEAVPVQPSQVIDKINAKQVSVQLMFCKSGTIASVTPLSELFALSAVADAGYNFCAGETVPAIHNATARFGHAVLVSDGISIETVIDEFYGHMQVLSADGTDMLLRPQTLKEIQ